MVKSRYELWLESPRWPNKAPDDALLVADFAGLCEVISHVVESVNVVNSEDAHVLQLSCPEVTRREIAGLGRCDETGS